MSDVEVGWRGDALWIRLNRPERRNAYDAPMAATIVEAFEDAPRGRSSSPAPAAASARAGR
jgi:2-ketocyclohexanecarboxyl-CoA hydrolase